MTERTQVFTFPSRMQVEMRGRTISAMKRTIEKLRGGLVDAHTEALEDATVKLIDAGDYPHNTISNAQGGVQWMNAIAEDRIYGLLATRMVTYKDGHEYNMELACLRCNERLGWSEDIRTAPEGSLVIYHMTEENAKIFKSGEPFELNFMGKQIKWKMLVGKDESVIEKLGRQDPDVDTDDLSLAMRLKEIEDVNVSDKVSWVASLGEERLDLQALMEEQACGLDTMMDVFCTQCQGRFEHPLPFDADFWVPLGKIRKRRRARSARAHGLTDKLNR